MAEVDNNQTGQIKTMSRQNRDAIDEMGRQCDELRNENLDLKEVIREMKREKLMGNQAAFQQEQFYNQDDIDPLINHFENYNNEDGGYMKRSLTERDLSKMQNPEDKIQELQM